MMMNEDRLRFKLLANKWDKVNSKGRPKNVGLPMLTREKKFL